MGVTPGGPVFSPAGSSEVGGLSPIWISTPDYSPESMASPCIPSPSISTNYCYPSVTSIQTLLPSTPTVYSPTSPQYSKIEQKSLKNSFLTSPSYLPSSPSYSYVSYTSASPLYVFHIYI